MPDKLPAYELKAIEELCDILLSFEEATDVLQGENIAPASKVIICVRGVIICVRGLRHQLENF